ncbi:unnamed protein product [Spodoptera littoralis]|uniref:Hexosyltransferase n=1 Tax=Spodoptera littoralis TaxID=7109 RepID=A0A9P0N762_SPOLI|nr:unnamed protein product [Spodoptera littoralis]CAH1643955.1 unnamed protein product [Spodoptera littoralis]
MAEGSDIIILHKILITAFVITIVYNYYTEYGITIIEIENPTFSLLGPFNTTQIVADDNYNQLIDINQFTFKINPQPCENYTAGFLLMIIVTSNPSNYENREVIRNTWGKNQDSTKVVFLVGESENINITNQIINESKSFGDIVQGSFIDAYRNMTYKHVMGLKWIVHHCPKAKYILKADDDILVNSPQMLRFLSRELSPWGAKDLIACRVREHTKALRYKSKWQVTEKEYAPEYYPTYCPGWAIIYSQDVVPRLLKVAQDLPYFWIDDVHITGVIAEKIDVPRTQLASFILSTISIQTLKALGPKYIQQFMFSPPDMSLNQITDIWNLISEYKY